MDIEEAKEIYWIMENCYQADCLGRYEWYCNTCNYNVTEKEYNDAITLLKSAGLIDEEGELI